MPKSPEERRAYNREYYRNMTPEQKARKRERQHRNAKRYYQKNAEKYRQQARDRRSEMTPEQRVQQYEYNKRYRLAHREELNFQRMIWKRKRAGTDLSRPRRIELPWTQPEIDILLTNYPKLKLKELALLLPGRTIPAILNMAKDVGIRRKDKINHFNEHFFDVPNLLNSYWAGFIAADGNVLESPYNKLSIILKYGDRTHIEQFAKDIEYDGGFIDRYRHHGRPNSPTFRQFGIQLNHASVPIAALRKNFNIVPHKSLILIPPNLTDTELCHAFIIGYIDGDGTICVDTRDKRLCLSFVGTKNLLDWIRLVLSGIIDMSHNTVRSRTNSTISTFALAGKRAERVINALSPIVVPKLDRKWESYKNKYIPRLPQP